MYVSGLVTTVVVVVVKCFVLCSKFQNVAGEASESRKCGVLYTEAAYIGQALNIAQGQQLSGIVIPHLASYKVYPGCELAICQKSTTTSPEKCKVEKASSETTVLYQNVSSASCSCPAMCGCERIVLGGKECARAYLEQPCSVCGAMYTNFKKIQRATLPRIFAASKISSVIVRPGCTLTLTTNEITKEIEGRGMITLNFTGEVVEKLFLDSIEEYSCSCSSDVTPTALVPTAPERQTDNFPPLLNFPDSLAGINSLQRQHPIHPGLIAALQSRSNRRSPKNAYILLLGLTGSGKSSTINFLFDNPNITRVSDTTSATGCIHEYRIPVPLLALGLNNSELRVIDTPGFVDTRGAEADATFLAAFDEYLSTHSELRRSLPNIVLIFSKFTDNRYSGEGSQFVRMLHFLNLFQKRLFDSRPNFIFVLTHTMSESRDILRDPTPRLNAIRETIQFHSTLPRPIRICLAENRPTGNIPTINGFYILPNNELYPKNVFDSMQMSTSLSGDPIGEAVIRDAFRNSLPNAVLLEEVVVPLKPTMRNVLKYMDIITGFNFKSTSTEIALALNASWAELSPAIKALDPEALTSLIQYFYLRNLRHFRSLPTTRMATLQFFQDIPKTTATLWLLENGLNMTVPELAPPILVGNPVSLLSGAVLPGSIFGDANENGTYISDAGFKLSEAISCETINQVVTIFKTFSTLDEWKEDRLRSFGLGMDEEGRKHLFQTATNRPGENFVDPGNTSSLLSYSAVIEYRRFRLALHQSDNVQPQGLLEELGRQKGFNETDWEGVEGWRAYFAKYGTHHVHSALGGGALEIVVRFLPFSNSTGMTMLQRNEELLLGVKTILEFLANLVVGKGTEFSVSKNLEYEIHQLGGDLKWSLRNLSNPDIRTIFKNWRDSILFAPVVLDSELQLGSNLELISEEFQEKLSQAMEALHTSSLVYKMVEPIRGLIASREETPIYESSAGEYQMMQEFAAVFAEMAERYRVAHENLFESMLAVQAKSEKTREEEAERARQAEERAFQMQLAELEADNLADERRMKMEMYRADVDTQRAESEAEKRRLDRSFEMQRDLQRQQMEKTYNANMMQAIVEENRQRDEASRSGFWNKLGDTVLSVFSKSADSSNQAMASALPMLLAAAG